ncbi:MAG: hypothetical protein ACOYL6_12000 [Bacteriovoracaceae bacterium]
MRFLAAIKLILILTTFFSLTTYADWNESDEVSTLQSSSEAADEQPLATPFPEDGASSPPSDAIDDDDDDF